MTEIQFIKKDNRLVGFEINGHSDYSEEGTDIVCAAVSSCALMAANTVTEIIGDNAEIIQKDGCLKVTVINCSVSSEYILEGLKLHLTEISKQYPKNVRINYGGITDA